MSTMSFIALLPAILAVLTFVVYRFLSGQKRSDDITKQIVSKLRADAPNVVSRIEGLTARQVSKTLEQDHELRMLVGDKNFSLINLVLRQEFVRSIIIYVIVALLFVFGVVAFIYLQTRPEPVTLSSWNIQSTHPDAEGLLVDLDELLVTWQASGPSKDFTFALENIQTKVHSEEVTTSSNEQKVRFPPESYHDILSVRARGKSNRIRVIARGNNTSFSSQEFDLQVGIEIGVFPIIEDEEVWISALIDNRSISNYSFKGMLLVYPKDGSLDIESSEGEFDNPKAVLIFQNFNDLDWDTAKFAYLGPDNPGIVRQQ
jgi:hypothetical protein